MKVDFAREIALKILFEIDKKNAYSNVALEEFIKRYQEKLKHKDINLISELIYGVTTWRLSIDAIISMHAKIKLNKISTWVKNILRMAIYQIVFLDKIPKSAAVNEAVNLTKKYGFQSASFVNAILRKVEKEDYEKLKQIPNEEERLSKVCSFPLWMVKKLVQERGIEEAKEIMQVSNEHPKLTLRINSLNINQEDFAKLLEQEKIQYEEGKQKDFIYVKGIKNLSHFTWFQKGYCTVQDEGAGKIALCLNPKPNEMVLDACSAPGGKTTHLAELMQDKGKIIAWDIHEHRVKLVEENAKRLGISIVQAQVKDATKIDETLYEKFDKILLDVPCLGLGVIKRKPDIKWQRKEEDIKEISEIQFALLTTCFNYLKKNGEMVYSTCSILKEENEEIIDRFLEQKGLKKVYEERIKPSRTSDGFYICKLVKG